MSHHLAVPESFPKPTTKSTGSKLKVKTLESRADGREAFGSSVVVVIPEVCGKTEKSKRITVSFLLGGRVGGRPIFGRAYPRVCV